MTDISNLFAHSGETHFNIEKPSQAGTPSVSSKSNQANQQQKIEYIDPTKHPQLMNSWYADPVFIFIMIVAMLYFRGFKTFRNIRRLPLSYAHLTGFILSLIILFIALCTPVDFLADFSFFMHMVQHILIIQIAAPLFCASAPHILIMKGIGKIPLSQVWYKFISLKLVKKFLRVMISPVFAIIFFNASFWFWHIPYFYNLALEDEFFHNLEHAMFFYSAVVFWWSIFTPGAAPKFIWPIKMLWIIISMMTSGILAALINFSDKPLYIFNENIRVFGLDPLTDQKVGALFMWVPGSAIYFILMAFVFFKGFSEENKKNPTYITPEAAGTKAI